MWFIMIACYILLHSMLCKCYFEPMPFSKSDSAGYLVNHLARLFAHALQAKIKPLGLSTGVFPVLLSLWERDGLTQKQLVDQVDVEQATMANTLARMERDGLVKRRKDPQDGRVQRIWLTDRARALNGPATEAAGSVNEDLLSSMSDDERQQILALIRKAIATIGERR